MRLLVDTVIALTLVIVLSLVILKQRAEQHRLDKVAAVQESIRAISSQALYRAATNDAEALANGYTRYIDIAWFDHVPRNMLVDGGVKRWIDYPRDEGRLRFNPVSIVAEGERGAFWYNGHRGIVRARVPRMATEQETVDLYNLVNGTSMRISDCRWDPPGMALPDGDGALTFKNAPPSKAEPSEPEDQVLRAFGSAQK